MSHANAVASAHTALREATAALRHGTNAQGPIDVVDPGAYRRLAVDVARTMDALATLLRATGAEVVPSSAASEDFQVVVEQVLRTVTTARQLAGLDEQRPPVAPRPSRATPDD
jgi:hypothetical protein